MGSKIGHSAVGKLLIGCPGPLISPKRWRNAGAKGAYLIGYTYGCALDCLRTCTGLSHDPIGNSGCALDRLKVAWVCLMCLLGNIGYALDRLNVAWDLLKVAWDRLMCLLGNIGCALGRLKVCMGPSKDLLWPIP